jgi:hypothetical protein
MRPIYMQHTGGDPAISYSGQDLRDFLAFMVRNEGILRPDVAAAGLKVTQRGAGANFSVDMAAGRAAVQGDDVADQGVYLIRSTATENVVTPTAPGSGTRVHRMVAQIRDKTHNGAWTVYDWVPLLLEDTGSGTPAVPNSALPLARISIAAGQANVSNANITDDRVDAALLSGKPPQVSSDAGRPPNPFVSQQIWRTDKGCYETNIDGTSTGWREEYVALGGPGWTSYTPAWTAATTNPVLNNGTATGRYMQIGKMVTFFAEIVAGSTTTYGSGNYRISLPVTAKTTSPGQQVQVKLTDSSVGQGYLGQSGTLNSGYGSLQHMNPAGNDLNLTTNVAPFTFANGDSLRLFGTYEAA